MKDTILVIVDDHCLIDLFQLEFGERNYCFVIADSAQKALMLCNIKRVAIVIVDVLANGSGVDEARKLQLVSKAPVLLMAFYRNSAERIAKKQLEREVVIMEKPFVFQDLLDWVENELRRGNYDGR